MKDLVKRISNIQKQILALKTTQPTSIDSYTFYKYTSPNLYSQVSGDTRFMARFISGSHSKIKPVCRFYVLSKDFYPTIAQDLSSPNICYVSTSSFETSALPDELYITCLSNVVGNLEITKL